MTDEQEEVLVAEEPETQESGSEMEDIKAPEQDSDTEKTEIPVKKKRPWNFIFLLLAGMLAIISPFVLIIGYDGIEGKIGVLGLNNFGSEFAYGWAIPFLGIVIIIYAIRARKQMMKIFALGNLIIGPILIALPFIIANHWLYKFDENDLTMPEFFFGMGDGWYIYLGGIFAIIAGVLAIVFGYRMFKEKEEPLE